MISVDAKKKELVGPFKNAGRTWRPKGKPKEVNTKDFPSLAQGKALPYGVYDSGQNRAVVNGGVTHDTAEFAVESILLAIIRKRIFLSMRPTVGEALA